MKDQGWQPAVGDKIGYIIVKGAGLKLFQRSRPFAFMGGIEPDYQYYVENQVIPAVARVLSVYGVKGSDLLKASD
jgi:DNA polymerase I